MIDPTFKIDEKHAVQATRAEARKTALVVASVLLLFAAWFFYRGQTTLATVLASVAVALALVAFFVPPLARAFHTGWLKFAAVLGYVNSRVLLTLLFYAVFTPYGFLSRLFRRDPLNRRGPKRESYWTPRKVTRQAREQFERLF